MSTSQTPATNLDVLNHPTFRRLGSAMVFADFADSLLFVTAAIWVKELTGSDAAAGLVFVFLTLPALLAPLNGYLADRFNRKTILVGNYLTTATLCLMLLLVGSPNQVWLIYLAIFGYSNCNYLTGAAQSGLVHALLPERMLPAAQGMLSSLDQGMRIVAPLLGAALFTVTGMGPVAMLASACFVVTALILMGLPAPKSVTNRPAAASPGSSSLPQKQSIMAEMLEGFRHITNHRPLRLATVAMMLGFGACTTLNVTNFASLEQGAGAPPALLSVLVCVQGLASVIGGVCAGRVIALCGFPKTSVIGAVLASSGIVLMAGPHFGVLVAGMAAVGFGVPLLIVAYIAYRQTATPNHLQGRVAGVSTLATNLPQAAVSWAAAAAITSVDYRWIIAAATVVCLASLLPSWRQHQILALQN